MKMSARNRTAILILFVLGIGLTLANSRAIQASETRFPPIMESGPVADEIALAPAGFWGGSNESISVVGNIAYVGEGAGLVILDISNLNNPVVLNRLYLANRVRDIFIKDDHVYVAVRETGLFIFSITTPSAPKQIGFYPVTTGSVRVAIAGDSAYVMGYGGFIILDISDPSSIQLLGSYTIPEEAERGIYGGDFDISNQKVYLAFSRYDRTNGPFEGFLYVVDVAVPNSPTLAGSFSFSLYSDATDVEVVNNIAYVTSGEDASASNKGLHAIDISNPANLQEIGHYPRDAYQVQILGDHAYLTGYDSVNKNYLSMIDISNPNEMAETAIIGLGGDGVGMFITPGMAYVATYGAGVKFLSITNNEFSEVGAFQTIDDTKDVFVSGNLAYVISRLFDGLRIIDISNPQLPVEVGRLFVQENYVNAYRIQVENNYAYIADAEGLAFWIIDVSTPSNPTVVKKVTSSIYVDDLMVVGTTAYIANTRRGLRIYDVSDPTAPIEIGHYERSGLDVYGVYVVGTVAYLSGIRGQLVTVDISNPTQPIMLDEINLALPLRHQSWRVAVNNNTAYLLSGAYEGGSVRLVNVTNPQDLILGPLYETQYQVQDIAFKDNLAVLSTWRNSLSTDGLKILDVSNPATPVEVGSYDEGGTGMFMTDKAVYLAGDGLRILRNTAGDTHVYLPAIVR